MGDKVFYLMSLMIFYLVTRKLIVHLIKILSTNNTMKNFFVVLIFSLSFLLMAIAKPTQVPANQVANQKSDILKALQELDKKYPWNLKKTLQEIDEKYPWDTQKIVDEIMGKKPQ